MVNLDQVPLAMMDSMYLVMVIVSYSKGSDYMLIIYNLG